MTYTHPEAYLKATHLHPTSVQNSVPTKHKTSTLQLNQMEHLINDPVVKYYFSALYRHRGHIEADIVRSISSKPPCPFTCSLLLLRRYINPFQTPSLQRPNASSKFSVFLLPTTLCA